jgi:hypothetical protein
LTLIKYNKLHLIVPNLGPNIRQLSLIECNGFNLSVFYLILQNAKFINDLTLCYYETYLREENEILELISAKMNHLKTLSFNSTSPLITPIGSLTNLQHLQIRSRGWINTTLLNPNVLSDVISLHLS